MFTIQLSIVPLWFIPAIPPNKWYVLEDQALIPAYLFSTKLTVQFAIYPELYPAIIPTDNE